MIKVFKIDIGDTRVEPVHINACLKGFMGISVSSVDVTNEYMGTAGVTRNEEPVRAEFGGNRAGMTQHIPEPLPSSPDITHQPKADPKHTDAVGTDKAKITPEVKPETPNTVVKPKGE